MSQQKVYNSCEQFVLGVYKALGDKPSKLQTFINLFVRTKKSNPKPIESQLKLVELIQDHPELVDQLNKLLPDHCKVQKQDIQASSARQREEDAKVMNKIFAELQSRRPGKLQQLIEFIQNHKNKKNPRNMERFKDQLAKIFEDEPNLLKMFMESSGSYFNEEPLNGKIEPEPQIEEESSDDTGMEIEEPDEIKVRNRAVRGAAAGGRGYGGRRGGKGGRRGGAKRAETEPGSPTVTPSIVLPVTVRNELNLFENLRTSLNKANYNQVMKIIYLFTECVIGANEAYQMAKSFLKGNDNYLNLFHEMLFAREKTRRKNTEWFKPLSDIDFEKMGCARNGSYSQLPEHFPHMKSPIHPKNPSCDQYLNKTWLSVPHGSEVNFIVTAKNTYEENLFKCEDERYEFDNTIFQYTAAIKWLDKLEETESKETINKIVDNILKLKIPQRVCGPNDESIEGLKKNPLKFAKKLAEKIQAKLNETKELRSIQAKKKWHETSIDNFHRSLDHRSFYFKQYEKKLTYHKNFLTDAISRHQDVNMLGKMQKLPKYLEVLNTFEGLSNGVFCHHPPLTSAQFIEPDEHKRYEGKILPIFHLTFPNKKINQEIYELLNLKIQYFHANFTEKEKITRHMKVFLQEILRIPYEEGETYDLTFTEEKMLAIVARIQAKIFDKTFSFNAVRIEEAEKNNAERTIYVAVEEGKKNKIAEVDEAAEDGASKTEKPSTKNGNENMNGKNDKMEEEPSPKKKKGGNKGDKGDKKGETKEKANNSDSSEPENCKEMEYSTENARNIDLFEPIARSNETVFYGTQHLYYLVRFYYTLYERLLKVFEIAQEFEDNPKSRLLNEEDKAKLSKERYDIFKWVLAHLIRGNLENEKYEDLLRCVFGNKAYLMFYVDRIVHMFIITIQKLLNDDISVKTLSFFTETELPTKNSDLKSLKNLPKKQRNWPEFIYLAQINNLTLENMNSLQTTTFFRFVYDPKDYIITINIYDSPYKNWNEKIMDDIYDYAEWYRSTDLPGNHQSTTTNSIFLTRNLKKNKKRLESDSIKIIQTNNLEWKYVPNTTKLVTDGFHREDVVQAIYTKKPPSKDLVSKIRMEFNRVERFQAWHQKIIKNWSGK